MLFPVCAFAEIYEWVDEKNRKHYTQIPPEDKSKIIRVIGKPSSASQSSSNGRTAKESADSARAYSDYLQSERLERKEKREEKKQQLSKLKKYCNQLRAELKDFKQGGVQYYELDDNGERVIWSDDRLQQEINLLQDQIKSECSSVK